MQKEILKKKKKKSEENLFCCRIKVVENCGAEVDDCCQCEEGLERSQPLHEVTSPYGAEYSSKCADRVCYPCSKE